MNEGLMTYIIIILTMFMACAVIIFPLWAILKAIILLINWIIKIISYQKNNKKSYKILAKTNPKYRDKLKEDK